MPNNTVTTIKRHRYANKARRPGDVYKVAGQSDLRLVKAMGWAIEAPAEAPIPPAVVERVSQPVRAPARKMAALLTRTQDAETEASAPAAKRAYKRRDLTAEGSNE